MSKVYAGIGSRSTPNDVLALMYNIACVLAREGWLLRSGNAEGADLAFQDGSGDQAAIFLPWEGFGPPVPLGRWATPTDEAYALAEAHHPAWGACSPAARKLHARNAHQVLGELLDEPARFVVCWTPDGSLDGTGPRTGGTGQALRIAAAHDIEVFNLQRPEHRDRMFAWLTRDPPAIAD